jgi:hypothetical protein
MFPYDSGIESAVAIVPQTVSDVLGTMQRIDALCVDGIRPTNPMTGGRGNSKTSLNLFVLGPSGRRELGDLLNRQIG